ncbi:uncharacterized protein LOC126717208 [Quercus robur]|uniref:uncharacterized protein LOC126717208 n=1 Tax=Quercus robur TaxID=38942 RepID=UPI002163C744|nr:uncharacterized protein LOC126717208 [Quercus robur]XP_050274616.1 uncharacterized protein LOC126717208 [Quercus robur]
MLQRNRGIHKPVKVDDSPSMIAENGVSSSSLCEHEKVLQALRTAHATAGYINAAMQRAPRISGRVIQAQMDTAFTNSKMQRIRGNSGTVKVERDGFLNKSEDKAGRTLMIATSMDPDLYKAITDRDIDLIQKRRHDMELSPLYDKTPELNTILHLAAASSDDEEFVQAILRIQLCQKFVTEKNSSGNLPLHEVVNAGHLHIVKLLVIWTYQQLQDPSTGPLREKNKEDNTPLYLPLINKYQAVGCNLALESKYNEMAKFFVLGLIYSFGLIYDYYATILKLSMDIFSNVHFH